MVIREDSQAERTKPSPPPPKTRSRPCHSHPRFITRNRMWALEALRSTSSALEASKYTTTKYEVLRNMLGKSSHRRRHRRHQTARRRKFEGWGRAAALWRGGLPRVMRWSGEHALHPLISSSPFPTMLLMTNQGPMV